MTQNDSTVSPLAFDTIAGFMSAYHRSVRFLDQTKNVSRPRKLWMVAIRKVVRRNSVNATKIFLLGKTTASHKFPEKAYITHIRAMTSKKSLSDENLLRNTSYDFNSFMSPAAPAALPDYFDPVANLSRIGSSDDPKVLENFEQLYGRSSRHLDISSTAEQQESTTPTTFPKIRSSVSSSSLGRLMIANTASSPQSRPRLLQSSTASNASQFIPSPTGISRVTAAKLFSATDFSTNATAAKRTSQRASPSVLTPNTSAQNSPAYKCARILTPLNVVPVPIVTPIPTSHRKVPLSLTIGSEECEEDEVNAQMAEEVSPLPTAAIISKSSHIARLKALRRSISPDTPRE